LTKATAKTEADDDYEEVEREDEEDKSVNRSR
jgi:hypothetical protein